MLKSKKKSTYLENSDFLYSKVGTTFKKSETFGSDFQSVNDDFEDESHFDYSIFE
jgi:hypothetical protein